jgi:hypothetical protein
VLLADGNLGVMNLGVMNLGVMSADGNPWSAAGQLTWEA